MSTSVMAYYGSKHSIAKQIVDLMPSHRGYVEPYAGSLSVLLAKPPSPFECVNDLDDHLMTFWRVLRDRLDELERVCALTPHSRAEYQSCWPIPDGLDDLERARRVWVKLSQGRGGQLRPTGWRYHEITRGRGSGMPTTLHGYVDRFAPAAARMKNVSIESLPALEVIERYGKDPHTVIYADPPYLGTTRSRPTSTRSSLQPFTHAKPPSCSPATPATSTTRSTRTGSATTSAPTPARESATAAEPTANGPRSCGAPATRRQDTSTSTTRQEPPTSD